MPLSPPPSFLAAAKLFRGRTPRHSQLTTTMNVYIDQVDGGLDGADAWDEILHGAKQNEPAQPGTATNDADTVANPFGFVGDNGRELRSL